MKTNTFDFSWGEVIAGYPGAEDDALPRAVQVARLETDRGPVLVAVMAEALSPTPMAANALRVVMKSTLDSLAANEVESLPDWLNDALGSANALLFRANDLVNSEERVALVVAAVADRRAYMARAGGGVVEWLQNDRRRLPLTRPRSKCPALGGAADLTADMGFYLQDEEGGEEQALRLGRAGLPLKIGEGLALRWVDGSPALMLRVTPSLRDAAAAPVAAAAPARPTPQEPARESTQTVLAESSRAPIVAPQAVFVAGLAAKPAPRRNALRIGLPVLALVALLAAGAWGSGLLRGDAAPAAPAVTQIVVTRAALGNPEPTNTAAPTATPDAYQARVAAIEGGASVVYTLADGRTGLLVEGDVLQDGVILTSAPQGSLRVELPYLDGVVILLPGSSAAFHLSAVVRVDLRQGGVWVGSGGQALEVRPSGRNGAARVTRGQMVVLVGDLNPMNVLCFSGDCRFRAPGTVHWGLVPAGEEQSYYFDRNNLVTGRAIDPVLVGNINQLCAGCLSDWTSAPTQAPTRADQAETPTPVPQDNNDPASTKAARTAAPTNTWNPTKTPTPTHTPEEPTYTPWVTETPVVTETPIDTPGH